MKTIRENYVVKAGRSREGAWIEIWHPARLPQALSVAPARERGLKSVEQLNEAVEAAVAPARERGLKLPACI